MMVRLILFSAPYHGRGGFGAEGERPIAGIIGLGGAVGTVLVGSLGEEDLADGADRIRYAAALARAHPEARVMVSGGQVFPEPGALSEALMIADLLVEFGVARTRIVTEAASRTTAESAALTAGKLGTNSAVPWLLVTSASHMPRATDVLFPAPLAQSSCSPLRQ